MTELLTADQMRAAERRAIGSGAVTGRGLMERAGQGVVAEVFKEWPDLGNSAYRAVILCGPGNNGGDGFVVARLLAERGWSVAVYLYGDPARLPPDAHANYLRWCTLGAVAPMAGLVLDAAQPADLYVDAVFGTGLARLAGGDLAAVLGQLAGAGADHAVFQPRLVAIDAPSGLCLDSGRMLGAGSDVAPDDGPVPLARLTVGFDRAKIGYYIGDGPACCGRVAVVDIGIAPWRDEGQVPQRAVQLVGPMHDTHGAAQSQDWAAALTKQQGHKYSHGHAVVLSGGAGHTGAARLAARAALRIGAGLVTLGVPPAAQQEVACHITALMLHRVGDADALEEMLGDARLNALCLGPGLGLGRARDLVPVALGAATRPAVVLDADALSAYGDAPDALFAMLHGPAVLTPHGGEFARLFPDIAARLAAVADTGPAYSKVDAARDAAARAGCVVLIKGADTVIAHPDGRVRVHAACYDWAAPWLATAGAGDVLAGFIVGLMARGMVPFDAAAAGAWVHAACARAFGPGLIAEDISEQVPQVFQRMLLGRAAG